ncbi:MAG TPA: division/cell wall cluster transcriptional repressor MraZ [Armatimonadota bacterium]|nr:division/cell wall cluster transcriptional repressor MraZ [Armatimonadota bacterium]
MFLGTVFHTIDEKGRIVLPPRFRLSLGERFIITCGLRRTLHIHTSDAWQKIAAQLADAGAFSSAANLLRTVFAGGAEEVSTDAQGRLTIPPPLREFAELAGDVVILGSITKIEIWSRARWTAFCENLDDDQLEDAARELNLN